MACAQGSLVELFCGEPDAESASRTLLSLQTGKLARSLKYDHSCIEIQDCVCVGGGGGDKFRCDLVHELLPT